MSEKEFVEAVLQVFRHADKDHNGHLDKEESEELYHKVSQNVGLGTVEQFHTVFERMDKNHDGKISAREFVEFMVEYARENGILEPKQDKLQPLDKSVFHSGLGTIGKTFNNARHAYLSLVISNKELRTIKVKSNL